MANKGRGAELCWILLKLPKHWLCLRMLLRSRICRYTAPQVSCFQDTTQGIKHWTHSYKMILFSFYSVSLSQKAPIYIHWAAICSCFKALPCPRNLLWSQEELADLNRGLSHHSSAQLARCSQTCHFIYSSPWLKRSSWFRFASVATCVVTLWPSFIRMLWVKKKRIWLRTNYASRSVRAVTSLFLQQQNTQLLHFSKHRSYPTSSAPRESLHFKASNSLQ